MRILIVGAGAIGGYFGGRLLQAGRDVTFLVRPRRKAQLSRTGLAIRSPAGDLDLQNPPMVLADALQERFDLILLSCKAYDLQGAIESFAPAVGPGSLILPLLNGVRHLETLQERFGADAVLGGLCVISAALDADGRILHLNDLHTLAFGERFAPRSDRTDAIQRQFAAVLFDAQLSDAIVQGMWEKWIFIAAAAGITCLMRAAIGDIVAAGAADLSAGMYAECVQIAAENGFVPAATMQQRSLSLLTMPGSPLTASMLRDIESGARTEADQIVGDLLRKRRSQPPGRSLLNLAQAHLKSYEFRRERQSPR